MGYKPNAILLRDSQLILPYFLIQYHISKATPGVLDKAEGLGEKEKGGKRQCVIESLVDVIKHTHTHRHGHTHTWAHTFTLL